jgi:hypothetical protein
MKKTILILVLLALVVSLGMAYKIGICAQNWCGYIACEKYHGVYVSKTLGGYVADGVLMKGDIITEALVFPACNCLGCCQPVECCNPCDPCNCNPCDPCNPCQSPKTYTFTPRSKLSSQLAQFCCESYCYKKTWNNFALGNVLDAICPGGTVVMRVYRKCTCQWMIAVLTRDEMGSATLTLYPELCPRPSSVEVIVVDPVCDPCTTSIQVIINN